MRRPNPRRVARVLLSLAACAVTSAAPLSAQVRADIYLGRPASAPSASSAFFPGGMFLCSATVDVGTIGTTSVLSFNGRSHANSLCGAPRIGSTDEYSIRFTGSFVAAAAGPYTLHVGTDDGRVLTVNGAVVDSRWQDLAQTDLAFPVTLNGGANPFTLDFYANASPISGASLRVDNTTIAAPAATTTAPEPTTWVLLASGLGALGTIASRRRRA